MHSCAATGFSPATSANSTKMTQLLVSDTDTPMAMPTSGPSEKGIWRRIRGVMFQASDHKSADSEPANCYQPSIDLNMQLRHSQWWKKCQN